MEKDAEGEGSMAFGIVNCSSAKAKGLLQREDVQTIAFGHINYYKLRRAHRLTTVFRSLVYRQ